MLPDTAHAYLFVDRKPAVWGPASGVMLASGVGEVWCSKRCGGSCGGNLELSHECCWGVLAEGVLAEGGAVAETRIHER